MDNIEEQNKNTNSKSNLPTSQRDLLTLAEDALEKWQNTPEITLLWMNTTDFTQIVANFKDNLNAKRDAKSGRSVQTQTLKDLDTEIDNAVEEIKFAILAKFGREKGKAYFAEFGIAKIGRGYRLPADRNQRLSALSLLAGAVQKYTLSVVGYEASFFENIVANYETAFKTTQNTDSVVSKSVSDKNEAMEKVKKILRALHTLVKVNYPDTYEGELRTWGFQK